ncbi:cell division protein ZapD [Acidithiobacillus ferriphilus]|jgi:cell division protein ZapD|uniref:cell division protein ZapD n=1 Tax=Acidithiobacillus ferriphilus TaxID=1689834 RepID=UPI001C067CC4|nr:cell division protein ZapD [Acidithiobacillus ferriphilus]MBU2854027.1 cell division protein ZapD [Acidithiobacillus ferriphilus]
MAVYEHPLHERARLLLRLESVFAQVRQEVADTSGLRDALRPFNELLDFCSRPELRLDVILELERLGQSLAVWAHSPEIDEVPLRAWQFRIDQQLKVLREHREPFGQLLRHQEIIQLARGRLGVAGGLADCDLPILAFWNQQAPARIHGLLSGWQNSLEILQNSTDLILALLRDSCTWLTVEAPEGRYGAPLDARRPPSLIRLELTDQVDYYPKISGGIHRFHIQLLQWLDQGTARAVESTVKFKLGLSAL